jgi:hypothetical protein
MGAIVMDNCVIESIDQLQELLLPQIQLLLQVRFGQVFQPKKSKDIDQSDFAGEIERI